MQWMNIYSKSHVTTSTEDLINYIYNIYYEKLVRQSYMIYTCVHSHHGILWPLSMRRHYTLPSTQPSVLPNNATILASSQWLANHSRLIGRQAWQNSTTTHNCEMSEMNNHNTAKITINNYTSQLIIIIMDYLNWPQLYICHQKCNNQPIVISNHPF